MSLIIEALKKARDDAVRRQAAARGLPLAPLPKLESRSRWLSLALIPLVAALVICVMLLIDVYSRMPKAGSPETIAQPSAVADRTAGDNRAPQAPVALDDVIPEDASAVAKSSPTGVQVDRAQSQSPATSRPDEAGSGVASTVGSDLPTGESSQSDSASSILVPGVASGSRSFTGQAQLEGGDLLDLGGIAWSESEPYALINGQVVGVGELIRSYRVTSITPNEVVLEKDQDRVTIRLD